MSYHGLGFAPGFAPSAYFEQAVDPWAARMSPPGVSYEAYGWGPGLNVGLPFNYTRHLGYERVPVVRRPGLAGSWSGSQPGYEAPGNMLAGLDGVLAVL